MDRETLERDLRYYFSAEVREAEPSPDWWDNAISRVTVRRKRSFWFGLMPKTRLAWVLLPIIILLISGTVYGTTSIVRELFHEYTTGGVEEAGLAQELNLSQTTDGVTVKLERAYADPNVVLVGFTVSGPEESYHAHPGELSTSDGRRLPGMTGMGVVPGSKGMMGNWESSERAAVITAFDPSSIRGNPSELNLTLETSVADSVPSQTPGQASVGPFKFDFSIPFHPGKVIDIGQTVEAAGVPITLKQVVISPWATRALFSFDLPPEEDQSGCLPTVSMQLPGGNTKHGDFGSGSKTSFSQYFVGDFTNAQGEWNIVIDNLDLRRGYGEVERLTGPWDFRFEVSQVDDE